MGLLQWLFGTPYRKKDDCFGQMVFLEHRRNPALNYWECKCWFRPLNSLIQARVYGSKEGPDKAAREFYRHFEEEYHDYCERLIPLLEAEFSNWKPEFVVHDFAAQFRLAHLELPRNAGQSGEWEMNFLSLPDHHWVEVMMKGGAPVSVHMEG